MAQRVNNSICLLVCDSCSISQTTMTFYASASLKYKKTISKS